MGLVAVGAVDLIALLFAVVLVHPMIQVDVHHPHEGDQANGSQDKGSRRKNHDVWDFWVKKQKPPVFIYLNISRLPEKYNFPVG
jgi:hypothetical protein